jgi:hypothetical protein
MARAAECEAVRDIVTKIRIIGIGLDVMGCKTTLIFLALATAALTDIIISFEYSVAPSEILGLFKSLPWTATFPFVVVLATPNATITTFGFELLGLRSFGYSSPFRFRSDLGSRLCRETTIERTFALNY